MEIEKFEPNLDVINNRKKIVSFGRFKNPSNDNFIIKFEKPPKFNRSDIIDIEEKEESKGVYVYKPSFKIETKESVTNANIYVPPSLKNEQTSVKVTNLPLELNKADLENILCKKMNLFPISTYVVLDHENKASRGYAYVGFNSRDNAKEAVQKIEGFVLDGLIFGAEIAKN